MGDRATEGAQPQQQKGAKHFGEVVPEDAVMVVPCPSVIEGMNAMAM